MTNRPALLSLLTLLVIAPAWFSSARADGEDLLDRADKDWRKGPVTYLLTKDESNAYRKLKTDDERAAFVKEFWEKRDPTPGTPANEFKERYASRLQVVQQRFGPPKGRGWEDDRGKVVLLLGPPDEIRISNPGRGASSMGTGMGEPGGPGGMPGGESGDAAAAGPAPRPRARFIYKNEIFPNGPTPAELEFMGDSSGGFRLLTRVDLSDPRLTGLEPLPVKAAPAPTKQAQAAPPPPAEAAAPPPPPPAPPTPGEILLDKVLADTSAAPPSDIKVTTRLDYYKTKDTDTLTTLTVEAGGAGTDPVVAARILDADNGTVVHLDKADSFSGTGDADTSAAGDLFQAAHNIPPGKYSLVTAVEDPATGKTGMQREEVEVPDFGGDGLAMSSLTLARKVEPAGDSASGKRFTLGGFRIYPAPDTTFRSNQDLVLYFQVYNAATDPNSGKPKLKVTYKFAKVETNRKIPLHPIVQDVDRAVQIYAITIAPVWPTGDYQVEVVVEDEVSKTSVSAIAPFKVVKEG